MAGKETMNINDILSDEDLEDCIDGTTNIDMIRGIINLTQLETLVDEESFADVFAYELTGFLDAEEGTQEWDEYNQNNWDWGYSIAQNINELVTNRFTK